MAITVEQKTCLRCGHKWFPNSTEEPNVCPKCKSAYWDKPYKMKQEVGNGDRNKAKA